MDITDKAITLTGSWQRRIGITNYGSVRNPQIIKGRTLVLADNASLTMDPGKPDQKRSFRDVRLVLNEGNGCLEIDSPYQWNPQTPEWESLPQGYTSAQVKGLYLNDEGGNITSAGDIFDLLTGGRMDTICHIDDATLCPL